MQNAKQHCSKCFIDHTPLPRWCSKYKKNENNKETGQQFLTSDVSSRNSGNLLLLKLLGGGRPKIVKPPKIRILAPENEQLNIVATIFRSMDKYWFLYDHHGMCKFVGGESCKFCAFRSISLRLNERKPEPFIQPHEIYTI